MKTTDFYSKISWCITRNFDIGLDVKNYNEFRQCVLYKRRNVPKGNKKRQQLFVFKFQFIAHIYNENQIRTLQRKRPNFK